MATNNLTAAEIPESDRIICPNCGELNDARRDTECTACGWCLVAWECPECTFANDASDYPICHICKYNMMDWHESQFVGDTQSEEE